MATQKKSRSTKSDQTGPSPDDILVADLISLLESGQHSPWQRPWSGTDGIHRNLLSGEPYRGTNPLLLEAGLALRQQTLPLWLGARQAREHKWFPRKGSKSVRIFRPQLNKKETGELDNNGDPEITAWVSFKVVPVFHVNDLDAATPEAAENLQNKISEAIGADKIPETVRIDSAEKVLEDWQVPVSFEGNRAYYLPDTDKIVLPPIKQFRSREGYIATRAHEIAHSTGHKSRLGRDLSCQFGSEGYAREELIAELAAALICNRLGISSQIEGHANYMAHWAQILRDGGSKTLISLLRKSKQAADMIVPEP